MNRRSFYLYLGTALAFATLPGFTSAPPVRDRAGIRDCISHATIVVLGSSTAAGAGAAPASEGWVRRYEAYLVGLRPGIRVINRAVGGYTTYHLAPTDTVPPPGRPKPDVQRNITWAVAQRPTAIIVNLPSNDVASSFSLEEAERNYEDMAGAAKAAGIPIWFTTTQPRGLSPEKRAQQVELRDWIKSRFGKRSIDFWTGFAAPDGTMLPPYDCGDHIHPSNAGHSMLFWRVAAAHVPEAACGLTLPQQ